MILDEVLMIYYDEPQNIAEKQIYERLHRSPYRNYLRKKRPGGQSVVYFMLIDKTEKILELHQKLEDEKMTASLKILVYHEFCISLYYKVRPTPLAPSRAYEDGLAA